MAKNEPNINFKALEAKSIMELDACTRCGECEDICPTKDATDDIDVAPRSKINRWRKFINRNYGLKAKLFGPDPVEPDEIEKFRDDLYTCTTCGSCKEVCPVNIDTVELWESLRQNLVLAGEGPYGKQAKFSEILEKYQNPYMEEKEERVNWIPEDIAIEEEAEIAYFTGCTASLRMRTVAAAAMRILNDLDIPFTYLGEDEECCGSVLLRTGQYRQPGEEDEQERIVRKMTERNVQRLKDRGVKKVLFSCAGCFRTALLDWEEVLGEEIDLQFVHISQFLADVIREGDIEWSEDWDEEMTVTYHDPCHLRLDLEIFEDPRYVYESIPGIDLVEMERSHNLSRCCGAGGGVKAGIPEVAGNSAETRCRDALETGADMVSSACPFCRLNLGDGIKSLMESGEIEEGRLDAEDLVIITAKAMGLKTTLNGDEPEETEEEAEEKEAEAEE
ncbi:(Fe-S)-binding protein [Methanonatronarchaeum sp. AMET6-2]|uniref:(Fe-S)-binding protein n=1 Tax=Methanonatronarchaeum sp. AMET6-2 TaxID=2933293 RepID=UPI0011F9F322|nr:(Fe-S)-binding protein [Methanonatronarchaeum sp. AMET6-2]RZN61673.1 MAG: (Fe-S)-binding protein [Methanonatronarchaeia archaeon]